MGLVSKIGKEIQSVAQHAKETLYGAFAQLKVRFAEPPSKQQFVLDAYHHAKCFENHNGKHAYQSNQNNPRVAFSSDILCSIVDGRENAYCLEYACMDAGMRLNHQGLKAYKEERYQTFSAPDAFKHIFNNRVGVVSKSVEIHVTHPERHWVASNQWGTFLQAVAEAMPEPTFGQKLQNVFLVTSKTHAMNLTVTKKGEFEGQCSYSVSFYDPNITMNHTKVRFSSLEEIGQLDLEKLIDPDAFACYSKPMKRNQDTYQLMPKDPTQWEFVPLDMNIMKAQTGTTPIPKEYHITMWDETGVTDKRIHPADFLKGEFFRQDVNLREEFKQIHAVH